MGPMTHDPFVLVVAAVVAVLAVGRATRLVTSDSYPPAEWARAKWINLTRAGVWSELATCPFCAAPYIAAGSLTWAWLSDLHWSWWALHLWLALSYAASMVVVRDEPPE